MVAAPLSVVVTGGIASGKTAVTDRFGACGIEIVDADQIARELVAPGQPALADIVARFGPVLDAHGRLDRAALRARVFADPAERQALEAILHPRIRQAMQARCRASTGPYVVLAIPLFAESAGGYAWVDRVLLVDVPEAVQRARLMRRDGIDATDAARMLAAQATRTQRLALAHDVIVNDAGLALLDRAVAALDARYRRLAGDRPAR